MKYAGSEPLTSYFRLTCREFIMEFAIDLKNKLIFAFKINAQDVYALKCLQ